MGLLDNFRKKKSESDELEDIQAASASSENSILDEFLEKDPYEAERSYLTPSGLYPHEVLLLDHASSYFTDETEFPTFWRTQVGLLDVPRMLADLVNRGFLMEASIDTTLGRATVQILKDALRKSALPVGGNKKELIHRLRTSLSDTDLYTLFPRRTFDLTFEGMRALDEAKYVTYLGRNPVEGLTIWTLHRKVTKEPESTYRDIIRTHLEARSEQHLFRRDYKAYRACRYRMYQFLMEEKKLKRAFPFLAEVMYYDLSGLESTSDPLYRYVSEKYFFPYDKSIVKLSAGNVNAMKKLKEDLNLSEEMLKALLLQFYGQIKLPAHLFTPEESAVIVLLELRGDTERLRQVYEIAEKRFTESL